MVFCPKMKGSFPNHPFSGANLDGWDDGEFGEELSFSGISLWVLLGPWKAIVNIVNQFLLGRF